MMEGHVEDQRPLCTLILRRSNEPDIGIEFQIDTAFRGFLTLPASAIVALNLIFLHRMSAGTADNRSLLVDVHQTRIVWNEEAVEVEVLAMGRRPLIGSALLDGHRLLIDFEEGGKVRIARLDTVGDS
jgi:clan AA aspartic protease